MLLALLYYLLVRISGFHIARSVSNDYDEWFVKRRNSEKLNDTLPRSMATNFKLENARKFPSHRFAFHLAALVEIGVEYFKNLIFHSIALCSLVIRLSRLDRHEYCVSETFEKIPTSDCVVEEAIFSAHGPRHESCYQHSKCVLLKSNNFVNSARLPLAASVISQVIIKKSCWRNILSRLWFLKCTLLEGAARCAILSVVEIKWLNW